MDSNRYLKILCWNIRGMNTQEKWDAIRDKISKGACHILCLQETKRDHFDPFYIKKFCPRNLDKFAWSPSDGASGGLLTVWNSSTLDGVLVHANSYALTCKFTSKLDNKDFHITNIYGPSNHSQKQAFATWLMNFDTSEFED
jgi:exonuclease III